MNLYLEHIKGESLRQENDLILAACDQLGDGHPGTVTGVHMKLFCSLPSPFARKVRALAAEAWFDSSVICEWLDA